MKKLLEILGAITIAGGGVLTLVANRPVSAQEKQTKLENSEINYLQVNNLETTLYREKRQNKKILDINENLIINEDKKENYKLSMEKIISLLISNNIFIIIFEDGENEQGVIYELNQNTIYDYFSVPVSIIIQGNDTRNITLVFRIRDLYLQGFTFNSNFYHFSDSTITNISGQNSHNLRFSSHYNDLMGEADQAICWQSIFSSFLTISNMGTSFESQTSVVRRALGRIVLITSESLRFRSIFDLISNEIIINNGRIFWNPESNSGHSNIRNIVVHNWSPVSETIIDAINNIRSVYGNINQSINEQFYNLLSRIPVNEIVRALANTDIRVILGTIMRPKLYCNNRRRIRDINNDIKNQYCDAIKTTDPNNYLSNKTITTIKILDANTKGDNLKAGDIYIGTNDGVYLKHGESKIDKFDNLNFPITDIILDGKGGAYAINNKNEIYYLSLNSNMALVSKGFNPINPSYEIKDVNDNYAVFVRTNTGDAYYLNGRDELWKYTVPFPVTSIYRFEKSGYGRNVGDVYFGTTNGVYLAKMGSWSADTKINGIDEEIVSIQTDRGHENSVHIKTISGKACFMDANGTIGWYNIPYPVTAIYRFEKGGFGRSAGDVYIGTTNGLYLSKADNNWNTLSKIDGINNTIVEIKDVNDNYAVFVRTNTGDAYYLNGRDELWKYTAPFPVTSIYRFETNIYNRNVGDVYFGTTNGVYLAKMGSWSADTKINGINNAIVEIKDVNDNYAVFVRTNTGDAYYLNGRDELWKYTVPFPVTSIYRFETNIYNRNVGDVYFGTTNGVYLAKMGSWSADTKINGINDKNNHDEL